MTAPTRHRPAPPARLFLLAPLVLSNCSGVQSALDTAATAAGHLRLLILSFTLICGVVWLLVMVMLGWALLRRRPAATDAGTQRRLTIAVSVCVAATVVIVGGLTTLSFLATRTLGSGEGEIEVVAVGQQWWWQFLYPAGGFQTVNELHIPVGRTVRIRLESPDVIHSFWVPSLSGKVDMIPGRTNALTLKAERPGLYRGQCAEFCGLQHSHMAFTVIAEDAATYARWMVEQARPARTPDTSHPDTSEAEAGRAVFLVKPCAACHTVRGTRAVGTTGPDLTHVGSRRTIAAGLLDTTRGTLAAWTADPQTLKPGTTMPLVPLTSDELRQVSAYLESLK
ncbi:cytochrome C oxidase subunit II [Rhizobium sp. Leaf384]|uniref:cytochrome c oxidase subunit II n=1 Tax=unclassified Rhizobium TaxID=2613769 RepID=UPI000713C9A3|nr:MULTISPECIES: cytochrome c oxidase subunit II [unclassified Rhizobium]KQS74342.1 cytochrome C oxidase subunit II [Rhizobium sp. Leaf384]KQS83986.1 cytochrome C oxidase subunit II [Rhizobium sp. Leaf383]